MKIKSAIKQIDQHGCLLVFPINNRPAPLSLWNCFYPKDKMIWEWSEDSDDRISQMWHLMKSLSDCRQVVYSKWYQGRATFFSRELFISLLKIHLQPTTSSRLSRTSIDLLEALESDSPLSTKQLKRQTDLQGRINESQYTRGMKALFQQFHIVAFGEVEDGAFPSLAVGSTRVLFEDLVIKSQTLTQARAQKTVDQFMPPGSHFRKFLDKVVSSR